MKFTELRLAEPIVRAVSEEGYANPTPIQTKAIPDILKGRDVLGCAQTGTGKTAAFALPMLHRLDLADRNDNAKHVRGRKRPPRALVLCPTRELASQIFDSFVTYGCHLKLRHAVVFGGVNQFHQVKALKAGVDVLIATPGRLMDLMEQGYVDLSSVQTFVLDEADRMLDMGFIHDIRRIAKHVPDKRQTLLFSATMPKEIRSLADALLYEPVFVQTAPDRPSADAITQSVYMVSKENKPALLERLLKSARRDRTLVFTRTKYGADKLVRALKRSKIAASAIHSNKSQNARTRALDAFKKGTTKVLIATDIASRGIDVDDISYVINYNMPSEPETYVHRIGRTARGGATGTAVSFCDRDERGSLRAIERLIRKPISVNTSEPDLVAHEQDPEMDHARNRSNIKRGWSPNAGSRNNRAKQPGSRGKSHSKARSNSSAGPARKKRTNRRRRRARTAT